MIEPDHRALRESLGYYVLGLLPAEERRGVAAHVSGCTSCRAQVTALQPLVGRLAYADPERLEHVTEPPRDLVEAVVAGIRDERTRSRLPRFAPHRVTRSRLSLHLAAAVLAAALVVGGLWVVKPEPVVDPQSVAVQVTAGSPVETQAQLVDHSWGMEVLLTGSGFTAGTTFDVTVTDRNGTTSSAGSFVGVGEAAMACTLTADVQQRDTVGLTILDEDGRPVAWSSWS